MRISRVIVQNYRNIEKTDIVLNGTTAVIGENNSGKTNLMRALSLPLFSEDNTINKNLFWEDICETAREKYYSFLSDNRTAIVNGTMQEEAFLEYLPVVSVELRFVPESTERYYVKDIAFETEDQNLVYGILYQYRVVHTAELLQQVVSILADTNVEIETVKRNLLPIHMFTYSITVPRRGDKVSHDVLKQFKYLSLNAERDGFSQDNNKIGSRSLVKLLQTRFSGEDLITVERGYGEFFNLLKNLGGIDEVINWQGSDSIPNATNFIKEISVLPNMPPMSTILSSVRLGYAGENLSAQGLGHRNLILLLVLLNSLKEKPIDTAISVLIVEEPEAHLCINNVRLMCSFINMLTKNNTGVQLLFSTHSSELINKHDLKGVVVLDEGHAYALGTELTEAERGYLSRNPNTDIFKLFFSHRCILVEGICEELLIKGYISSKAELSDIDVISFHKGFTNILDIWIKLNAKKHKRLGIIRDFDNQPAAQVNHERYNNQQGICVQTTSEYTLEPEIVKTGNNYALLKERYGEQYGWSDMSEDDMSNDWRNRKADVMLTISNDLSMEKLTGFTMPTHIQTVIDYLMEKQDGN